MLGVLVSAGAAICLAPCGSALPERNLGQAINRPIEQRHGAPVAILISSLFFMAVHLTKDWATVGMVPIILGAGILLGLVAWSSGSLIPCILGHTLMDIGLFGYWWTGIAGDFTARTIANTGVDRSFLIACTAFAASLFMVLFAISGLRRAVPRHLDPPSQSISQHNCR
jgi:hypothetical protein